MIVTRASILLVALGSWLTGASQLVANISFPVTIVDPGNTYATYHKDVIAAVQGAGAAWDLVLEEPRDVSIEVQVNLGLNIATATGGSATSVFVSNDGVRNVWEQGAAAEVRSGIDPNGVEPDVIFDIGANYLTDELWFDPEPIERSVPVPLSRTDAVSVFIHEFGHAFAFNGWINWATGERPEGFHSTFDALTTSPVSSYRFNGERSKHLYREPIPLTSGNIYHFANGEGEPGHDLVLDVMNGVASLRGTRGGISGYMLAVAEDIGLPIGVDWECFSRLAFKQWGSVKILVPDENDDGDASTNFQEFVQGTDPLDPSSVHPPTFSLTREDLGFRATINFPLIRSLRNIEIQPESSLNLEGSFIPQGSAFRPESADSPIQFADYTAHQLNDPTWFVRVRAKTVVSTAEQEDTPAPRSVRRKVTPIITGPPPVRRECLHCLRNAR